MTQAEESTTLSKAAMQHLLGHSVDLGMAWAGAAHWRYRTRAATKPAAAKDGAAAEEGPPVKPVR